MLVLAAGFILAWFLKINFYITKVSLALVALSISRIVEHFDDKKEDVNAIVSKVINVHYLEEPEFEFDNQMGHPSIPVNMKKKKKKISFL